MNTSSDPTAFLAESENESVDPTIVQAEAQRRRTFRRWVFGIGACLVALVVVRLIWGFVADWRLNAEIEKYRAAGEPLLLEDFVPPFGVKDEENAAVAYRRATAALVTNTSTKLSLGDLCRYGPNTSIDFPDDAQTILEANRESLSLIRQARDMPKVDWGYHFTGPTFNRWATHLSSQRWLSHLVSVSAMHQHNVGNDAGAIESVFDALAIAETLQQPGAPLESDQFDMICIDYSMCYLLEKITPTLKVHKANSQNSSTPPPASRARVESLIRVLQNEDRIRSRWRDAMNGERATALDSVRQVLNDTRPIGTIGGTATQFGMRLFLSPAFKTDAIRMMRYTTSYRKAGLARNWIEMKKAALPHHPAGNEEHNFCRRTSHLMRTLLMEPLESNLDRHFHTLAMRRMAATALAIRLYEIDHGQRPTSLATLVPAYLDALPKDPFAGDGRTFGYRRNDVSPYLYSMGSDGVDDKGELEWLKCCVVYHWKRDVPFFLNGDRPRDKLKLQPMKITSTYYIVTYSGDVEHDRRDAKNSDEKGNPSY